MLVNYLQDAFSLLTFPLVQSTQPVNPMIKKESTIDQGTAALAAYRRFATHTHSAKKTAAYDAAVASVAITLAALKGLSACVDGMDQFSLDEDFEAAQTQARAVIARVGGVK